MIRMTRTMATYLMGLLALVSVSCTDENGLLDRNEFGSQVEREGSDYVSSFHIDRSIVTFSRDLSKIRAHFTSLSDGSRILNIETHIEHHEDKHLLRMRFAKKIMDGDYKLRFTREKDAETRADVPNIEEDLPEFVFNVTVEDMMVKSVSLQSMSRSELYGMIFDGDGTEAEPYKIGSANDFDRLKAALSKDSEHGAGLFFKQTAAFDAPRISETNDDSYSSCFDFAGAYDGGGFKISDVSYMGGGDSLKLNLGLFAALLDGAKVSNLTVEFDFDTTGDNCGGLAGRCSGNVVIENVYVDGAVTNGHNNVGGLVGNVSAANLTVKDCTVGVSLSGVSYIGGSFGRVEKNSTITVDGITNMDKSSVPSKSLMTKVEGSGEKVGGLAGSIESSTFDIKNVRWQNTVDENNRDVKHISGTKGYVGGLVGYLSDNTEASILSDIQLLTPVHSEGNNVGGIVGCYHSNLVAGSEVHIQNVTFASYIKGEDRVGGFFGGINDAKYIHFDAGNRISQVSNGYLKVEGNDNVGGVIGYAQGNLSFSERFDINIDVEAGANVGGCVGGYGSGTLSCKNFTPSAAMTVSGDLDVGGIVGELYEGGHIVGAAPSLSDMIDDNNTVPAASQFKEYSTFAGTVSAPNDCAGGIVASIKSKNCKLSDLVFTGTVKGGMQAGGIVGYLQTGSTSIHNCINMSNKMIGKSSTNVGGIVGEMYSGTLSLDYCSNYASINCNGEAVAGIVAKRRGYCDLHISNAVNVGDIKGSGITAGVFALYAGAHGSYDNWDLYISESANYGNITSTNGQCVAGILGKAIKKNIKITACANHGDIHGDSKTEYVGGLAGFIGLASGVESQNNVQVIRSCNKGDISSKKWKANIAGLIGYQGDGSMLTNTWGTFDCYNTGNITSDHDSDTGGLLGYADYEVYIQRCINTGKVSHGNGTIGTHPWGSNQHEGDLYFLKGTGGDWKGHQFDEAAKKDSKTFKKFDFDKVWAIDSNNSMNNGYPYLINCKYQNMKVK